MNAPRLAAAFAGVLVVAAGAFGGHALEGRLSPEASGLWNTATLYGLTHAGAAIAASGPDARGAARLAAGLFAAGVFLFCGSLYALGLGAPRPIGMITPIGGLMFLAGWAALAVEALRDRR